MGILEFGLFNLMPPATSTLELENTLCKGAGALTWIAFVAQSTKKTLKGKREERTSKQMVLPVLLVHFDKLSSLRG